MSPYERYIDGIRSKWKLTKLEVSTSGPSDNAAELGELVKERERQEQANYQLAFGSCDYGGKRVKIFFNKSRVERVVI